MRLSLASWSLAACSLGETAGIARVLGLDGIDLGYRHAAAINRARVLSEPEAYAAELRATLPVAVANVWHLFGADRTVRQMAGPPDPRNLPDARTALQFSRTVGAPTLFVLPGLIGPGQSRRSAMSQAIDALGPMVDAAAAANVTLTVEPHVHAGLESPAMALDLLRAFPGLKLTLDPAHFTSLGFVQDEIETLCAHTAHVHLRQARPGVLQCRLDDGTINFPAFLAALRETGYDSWLSIEYLNQPYMGTTRDDALLGSVRMRDLVRGWLGT